MEELSLDLIKEYSHYNIMYIKRTTFLEYLIDIPKP